MDAASLPGDQAVTAWLQRHWRLLAVMAAAVAVFGQSVAFPFSLIDDRTFVLKNPLVAHPFAQGLYEILVTPAMGYPHTVTVLSFALDYRFFGTDPAGYHAVNVLLHLGAVGALYVLLLRLGVERAVAGTALGLFALHPLVVEPICWVIGRKDILATGLLVAAMGVAAGSRDAAPRAARLVAVNVLVAMAMLSKPSTILAPAMLWPFLRAACPAWSRRDALAVVLPSVASGAAIAGLSLLGLRSQGVFVERTRLELLIDPLRAATLQFGNLFWPRGLLAEYYRVPGDPPALAMACVLAFGLAAAWLVARWTRPRSLERLGFVLFAVAFLPASGVLPTAHWSADSYFYLPLAWLTLALAVTAPHVWPGLAGFPLVVIALAVLSTSQARTWASPAATLLPVVARYPDEPRALNRLAFALGEAGDRFGSARTFTEIEERFPEYPYNRGQRASSFDVLRDRRRADQVYRLCVAGRDVDCSVHFWMELLAGRRMPRDTGSDIVGGTYEVAGSRLVETLPEQGMQRVIQLLRGRKLELLARRAEQAVEEKRATAVEKGDASAG